MGGVQTYLRALLPLLRARGHELLLFCEVPARGAVIDDDCRGLTLISASELVSLRADVCLAHGLIQAETESELVARFPSVLYAHGYYGTCISGIKRNGWLHPAPCSRSFGLACLAHYYPRRCGGLNPITAIESYTRQRRRAELLPRYRSVLVASAHMAEEYRRSGVAPERIAVVPLFATGCDPDPGPPSARHFSNRVLMVARLVEAKGGQLLVTALRLARERLGRMLTLVVAGEGPDFPAIERAAATAGIALEAVGWVDAQRRTELMRGVDLLAVPGTFPEPFGLVGVESACVGLPAAAFALGGITDWLEGGRTGELAPANPPTAAGLADAIVRALRSERHWQALREGAWKMALEFSSTRHVEGLELHLRRALSD